MPQSKIIAQAGACAQVLEIKALAKPPGEPSPDFTKPNLAVPNSGACSLEETLHL